MKKIKILVADDDPIFRELVCSIVKKEGYYPVEACDGEQALEMFHIAKDLELLILDVMMPCLDGWEVLKRVREESSVPIIMLTALGDEIHEVKGLKKGADDYIAKPFSYEVFVARLHAQLRNIQEARVAEISIGSISVNKLTHKVIIGKKEIDLNHKEYELLLYLYENRNRVLSRDQIIQQVWDYSYDGDIRTIDTHIKTLRSKLLSEGELIKTVRGSGYMLEVPEK